MVVIEHVLRNHLRLGPVDGSFVNAMADAKDHKTVAHFLEQVLDEAVFNLHGVNPKTGSTLLTCALDIIIDDSGGLILLSSQLL